MSEIPLPFLFSEISARLHAADANLREVCAMPELCALSGSDLERLLIAAYLMGFGAGIGEALDEQDGNPSDLMKFVQATL